MLSFWTTCLIFTWWYYKGVLSQNNLKNFTSIAILQTHQKHFNFCNFHYTHLYTLQCKYWMRVLTLVYTFRARGKGAWGWADSLIDDEGAHWAYARRSPLSEQRNNCTDRTAAFIMMIISRGIPGSTFPRLVVDQIYLMSDLKFISSVGTSTTHYSIHTIPSNGMLQAESKEQ